MEKKSSFISQIKKEVEISEGSRRYFTQIEKDKKTRVRFISDFEKVIEVETHEKFGEYEYPCQKYKRLDCPACARKEKTKKKYYWTVYDYEKGERRLFVTKPTKTSPINNLIELYEANGDLREFDIVFERKGEGYNIQYLAKALTPKPAAFKNLKPYTKNEVFATVFSAYPVEKDEEEIEEEIDIPFAEFDNDDDDIDDDIDNSNDDDEEEVKVVEKPKKQQKKEKPKEQPKEQPKKQPKKVAVVDEDDDDEFFDLSDLE